MSVSRSFYLAAALAAFAAMQIPAKTLVEEKADFKIGNRSHKSWTFAGADRAKGRVTVSFNCRIDYPRQAGWCPCWQISVNGVTLTASATRSHTRLLNRPFFLHHKWFGKYGADNRSDKWYALYEPEFHASDKCFTGEFTAGDSYVLDISDMVVADGRNVLKFSAGGVSSSFYKAQGVTDRTPGVVFGNLRVSVEEGVVTKLPPFSRRVEKAVFAASPGDPEFRILAGGDCPGGELTLLLGDASIPVVSRFSMPGGGLVEMKGLKSLDTPFYSVSRKMIRRANRIDFFDTFTSKTNSLIGVKIRYETPSDGFDPVYVAGDPSPSADEFSGGRNPSTFGVRAKDGCGVAFLAQDDVFRVQNVQYCRDGAFGIRTDGMALVPGESRTVEWSVYPVPSGDYWDFINAVRRDWDVNFAIAGCFNLSMNCYARWEKRNAEGVVRNMGLSMDTFGVHYWSHLKGDFSKWHDGIWGMGQNAPLVRVKIDDKTNITASPEPMNAFERKCIANCRRYTPEIKVLTYLHGQICVDAGDDKYEDCRMVNAKGKAMNYNGGATQKIFVPTEKNLYGRDFMKLVDWQLDTFGLDGIYLDEINHCNSRLYYGTNLWDGATVELDDGGNLLRKVSFVCLLKLKFTTGLFNHVINERGKMMVGNFSPETRSERAFKFPRFEETYSHRWVALSHLYTPIQLGDMLTYGNNPKDMAADQRDALMRGALYYHYCGDTGCPSLTSRMFPFTPVELHSGWLVGKERILTAVSGDFGWRGEKPEVDVFVFDGLGRHVPGYPFTSEDTPLGRVFRLELKPDHCAAIVRR